MIVRIRVRTCRVQSSPVQFRSGQFTPARLGPDDSLVWYDYLRPKHFSTSNAPRAVLCRTESEEASLPRPTPREETLALLQLDGEFTGPLGIKRMGSRWDVETP